MFFENTVINILEVKSSICDEPASNISNNDIVTGSAVVSEYHNVCRPSNTLILEVYSDICDEPASNII